MAFETQTIIHAVNNSKKFRFLRSNNQVENFFKKAMQEHEELEVIFLPETESIFSKPAKIVSVDKQNLTFETDKEFTFNEPTAVYHYFIEKVVTYKNPRVKEF